MEDILWKHRLQNYEKAFLQLKKFRELPKLNEFEEQGLIQCFEYNYELAWNLMKDYLTYEGIVGIGGSRDAIRQAFNKNLISDGEIWMKMVDDRILSVHSYNQETAEKIAERVFNIYFELFENFLTKMKSQQ